MAWLQFPRGHQYCNRLVASRCYISTIATHLTPPPPHPPRNHSQRVYNIILQSQSQRLKKFTGNGALDRYIIGKVKSLQSQNSKHPFFFFFPSQKNMPYFQVWIWEMCQECQSSNYVSPFNKKRIVPLNFGYLILLKPQ